MASDVCFRCGADLMAGSPRCTSCGAPVRSMPRAGSSFSLFRAVGYVAASAAFVLILVLAWQHFIG